MHFRYRFIRLLVIAAVVHLAVHLPAQERPRFEGFRGTQRETVDSPESPPPLLSDRDFQNAERAWRQSTQSMKEQSTRLADFSFEAYRHGLITLPDHLAQLKLAESAERLLVPFDEDGSQLVGKNVERLQRVVAALEGVNLSQAWRSELLLSRALLAEAGSETAAVEGNAQRAEAEHVTALNLAEAHLLQRQRESVVGFRQGGATRFEDGELVNDARFGGWGFFIYAPEAYTELPADVFLQDAVSLLRSWRPQFPNEPGSEEAFIAQYQLGRFHLRQILAGGAGDVDGAYRAADEAARQLFAVQVELYRTGTSSLFDIALAWELRDELAEVRVEHELAVPPETETELQSDLQILTRLARMTPDRRGRLQADLMYIDLLVSRQEGRQALAALQNSGRPDYLP